MITTANVTAWKSGQLMLDTIQHGDFGALQKTHPSGYDRMAAARRCTRRKGWAAHFQAADKTGQHEAANRGGVELAGPLHISSEVPANFNATMDDASIMAPEGVQQAREYLRTRNFARHVHPILIRGHNALFGLS